MLPQQLKVETPKYQFQYIVIGDSSVGKTSLISRFSSNTFHQPAQPTLGVDFVNKIIQINNQSINIQIWDTAGSEKFSSITRNYYKQAIGIFMVFDITSEDSFQKLQHWHQEALKNAGKHVEFVVIGNKSDLSSQRQVSLHSAIEFCQKINALYIETSAKENYNVREAFEKMTRAVFEKIESGVIDPKEKTSGARYSDMWLMLERREGVKREQLFCL